jgi:hypothetical protein
MEKNQKLTFRMMIPVLIACLLVAACSLTNPPADEPDSSFLPDTQSRVFQARILEVFPKTFLVEPVEGSPELNSADKIEIPIKNMDPGPEPQVGDLIEISYRGGILETYPAKLQEVDRIRVVGETEVISEHSSASTDSTE